MKARTALAATLAHVDKQRLNEAISDGFYPCAPETVRGKSRHWDVNDIIALRIYGHLIDEGVVPRSAGEYASGLRQMLASHLTADRAICVTDSFERLHWVAEFNVSHNMISGVDITSVRIWPLEFLRARIEHQMREELHVAGED